MRSAVWRYPLHPPKSGIFLDVEMPVGTDLLHVGLKDGEPQLWARVEVGFGMLVIKRRLAIVPTGYEFKSDYLEYIGTFTVTDKDEPTTLVFHVFDAGSCSRSCRSRADGRGPEGGGEVT